MPHQPRIKIGYGTVSIILISRLNTLKLRILTVEYFTRLRASDFLGVIVAFILPGADSNIT
ncbi:MAG: hypothetical protein QGG15_03790 [Dehalococcoidales bacterium]|nr:hypothetical protein [Dehalococcoidales bacterium]MDP6738126.1 hypothetical protein [Dehalococcoidales bacterium]